MGDMLTQDEINALLGGKNQTDVDDNANELTPSELQEIQKVSEASTKEYAKTLEILLKRNVQIGEPSTTQHTLREFLNNRSEGVIGVEIDYKLGIEGYNILVIDAGDVKIFSNLMLGKAPDDGQSDEITEMDKSALCEIMNQMVGSSLAKLSDLLNVKINIHTPKIIEMPKGSEDDIIEKIGIKDVDSVCVITYPLKVEDLIDTVIIQVMPVDFCKTLISRAELVNGSNEEETLSVGKPGVQNVGGSSAKTGTTRVMNNSSVSAQSVQFQNFDVFELEQQKENIEIIMDVPLEVTVEMGRATKKIQEILEFSPGTIIELDKLAGDPIDILVNGKFVAKGEVVVIDENYGIRITDIVNVSNRI